MRQSRKLDHLKYTLALADGPGRSGFADLALVHNCLPDLAWADVSLATSVAGIPLRHPVVINAVTGGAADVAATNAALAEVARRTGAAMAVGSQYAACEDASVRDSFAVVRRVNPDGIFFANLGAHASPADAVAAVDMVGAAALQIHLNVAQELVMTEGDRDFTGYLANIAAIAAAGRVPVIAKEVGCGVAREQATALAAAGALAIDVGGMGGTNFLAIEAARSGAELSAEALAWGIPTAVSAVEVASVLPRTVDMIVSGGVRTPLDAAKALALGGRAVGIAAPLVRLVHAEGAEAAALWLAAFLAELRRYMALAGAKTVGDLAAVPVVITGATREWLIARDIDLSRYSRAGR